MKSITRYLLLNASIWAVIVAFASGLVLTEFFRTSAEKSFDDQLDIALKILVGDLASKILVGEELQLPDNLGEPRFELPLSGWYWKVSRSDSDEILLSSPSLVGGDFRLDEGSEQRSAEGNSLTAYGIGPEEERIRILQREISFFPTEKFVFNVTGNAEVLDAQVSDFQRRAWLVMAIFGAILLIVSGFLVRIALRPLNLLQEQVRKVTEGKTDQIEGQYPKEVSGLVSEANLLIASNKDTLERARTQVGNLAHALKTPLSVINNETRALEEHKATLITSQVDVMRDQVHLYLDRARMAAGRNVIGVLTDANPTIEKLVSVMRKIHRDKEISFSTIEERSLRFRGEDQDLEEMVGNLVDNACKWARMSVAVSLKDGKPDHEALSKLPAGLHWLTIEVEDDGRGMNENQMAEATKRGKRLDETVPGSGLGLSIVDEMASLYQGAFLLDKSAMGGVKATLVLPALEETEASL